MSKCCRGGAAQKVSFNTWGRCPTIVDCGRGASVMRKITEKVAVQEKILNQENHKEADCWQATGLSSA